jgi:hypothetical protein
MSPSAFSLRPSAFSLFPRVDLNLPLGGIALLFVIFFLNFKVPQTNFREKLAQMDWMFVNLAHL